MTLHLASQRMLLPSAQVSTLTSGSITLPSARGPHATGSYESIQTVALASSATTVSFTSIPQTYKHLQVRFIARENSGTGTNVSSGYLRFNSDSGSNYQFHYALATTSATAAGETLSVTGISPYMTQNASQANAYCGGIIDILDYTDTNKHKTCFIYQGADLNGVGQIDYDSGCWRSTSAITRIDFYLSSSYKAYSHFALYGING